MSDRIKSLNSSQSTGRNTNPTKIMKTVKDEISIVCLTLLINLSILGYFETFSRLLELYQYLKVKQNNDVTIIVLLLYL